MPPWEVEDAPLIWLQRWLDEQTLMAKLESKTSYVDVDDVEV